MPRYLLNKRRRKTSVRAQQASYSRFQSTTWRDPFARIMGTGPEKKVYAELSRRGIPFWFQNEITFRIPEVGFMKNYRPDFALPGPKIIIEVQGSYWHSQPETIESDAYKMAIYQTLGWKVLIWWDYQIERDLMGLFAVEPALQNVRNVGQSELTETSNGRKVIRDDAAGIRTMNRLRAQRKAYKKPAVRVRIKR